MKVRANIALLETRKTISDTSKPVFRMSIHQALWKRQRNIYLRLLRVQNQDLNFNPKNCEKRDTLKDASRTHSANEFISWEHSKIDLGVLWAHFGTGVVKSWGGYLQCVPRSRSIFNTINGHNWTNTDWDWHNLYSSTFIQLSYFNYIFNDNRIMK